MADFNQPLTQTEREHFLRLSDVVLEVQESVLLNDMTFYGAAECIGGERGEMLREFHRIWSDSCARFARDVDVIYNSLAEVNYQDQKRLRDVAEMKNAARLGLHTQRRLT